MSEIIANIHMHTRYSDGSGNHAEIVRAALNAGIDVVIITDHNVWVNGLENYYSEGDRRVLMLVGEEVHDQNRQPQKNHMLVIGAGLEVAGYAANPQELINSIRQAGGLSFIAHPVDPEAPAFDQPDISWVDWQVASYTGIELWNGMSEFKSLLRTKLKAIYFAYNPHRVAHGPFPAVIQKWDELLSKGQRVVAIGGTDAHAFRIKLGPLKKVLYPYEFHFHTINTHLMLPKPLSGEFLEDRNLVLAALSRGNAFIGYDLPASTKGFRFTAQGMEQSVGMGENTSTRNGVTLQIRLPVPVECRLIKDGNILKTWQKRETCTHITNEPGVYRVEAYINYKGRERGWIFSNPIYLTK